MSNGMKVGLLAVIAAFLGVIANKMYSGGGEEVISKPIGTEVSAVNQTAAVAQPSDRSNPI